jgi:hypothetical protein
MSNTTHWRRQSHTPNQNNPPSTESSESNPNQNKNENDVIIQDPMNQLHIESQEDSKPRDRRRDNRGRRSMAPPPKVMNSRAALLNDAPDVVHNSANHSGFRRGDVKGSSGGLEVRLAFVCVCVLPCVFRNVYYISSLYLLPSSHTHFHGSFIFFKTHSVEITFIIATEDHHP